MEDSGDHGRLFPVCGLELRVYGPDVSETSCTASIRYIVSIGLCQQSKTAYGGSRPEQLSHFTKFFSSETHFEMFVKDAALWRRHVFLGLLPQTEEGTPGYVSNCFGRKTFRSLLDQSDFDSQRNSSPVQDDFGYGCLSSSSSSPPLLPAVLPEMRRCWQCLCNNRWKLEINTSCFSRYSPLSIYF